MCVCVCVCKCSCFTVYLEPTAQSKKKVVIIITHRGCSVFWCCIVSFNFQWLRTLSIGERISSFFSIVIKINKNCIFADFVASYRGTKLRSHKAWLLGEIQEPPWTSENKMDEQLMCDCGHFQISKSTFGELLQFQCKKQMKITVCRLALLTKRFAQMTTHTQGVLKSTGSCGLWDTLASAHWLPL